MMRLPFKHIVLIGLTLLLIASVVAEEDTSDTLVVIAHKGVPIDNISSYELLDYYSYDIREWQNNQPIVIFDLEDTISIRKKFFDFIGKKSSRMKSVWLKKMLSGEGDPPEAMINEEAMIKKVAATPGAIGFISRSALSNDVKVLAVIE